MKSMKKSLQMTLKNRALIKINYICYKIGE